jgi:hypothetical protein
VLQWAEMHNIPPDDSLYWLAVMLKPELSPEQVQTLLQAQTNQMAQQLATGVEQGFDLMAEAMEHFSRRLEQLEDRIAQSKPHCGLVEGRAERAEAKAARLNLKWLPTLVMSLMGTAIGIGTFIWGYQASRPAIAPSTLQSPTDIQAQPQFLSLDPSLNDANQDRLKRCLADGNTKCTLLIRPPS